MVSDWRYLSSDERAKRAEDIHNSFSARLQRGALEHGYSLRGDAVDHIEEEALDILAYLTWARREIDHLREENDILRTLLDKRIEEGIDATP